MNVSKFNDEVEAKLNDALFGMHGNVEFNRDRNRIFKYFVNNMLKRTLGMFEYKNLPSTISPILMEKLLQGSGTALLVNVKEEDINNPLAKGQSGLYVLPCKAGGMLNAKFLPTRAVATSSWLGSSFDVDLEKDEGIYLWNDSLREGLSPMFSLYGSELTDNVLTQHFQEVHNRILSVIKANSEDERDDAIAFFTDYENGKFAALMNEDMIEGLKKSAVEPFKGSSNSSIKDTLEARQWLLAHWNIEIGLNDNYNMKREALNEAETEANADTLTPLIDDMMKCRKRNVEEINRVFGTDIQVDFSSSWKRVHKREENAQKVEDAEAKIIINQSKNEEGANEDAKQ